MLDIIKKDPWLSPFRQRIEERRNHFLRKEQELTQKAMQMAGRFAEELYIKAKVMDNRYLFF